MKRSILLSMLVIGAVAAMITAVTTATFTDQVTSADNDVENAVIMISVDTECALRDTGSSTGNANAAGEEGCTYTADSTDFAETDLLPGEYDTHTFNVVNDGTRAGDLTVSIANEESSVVACDVSNWDITLTGDTVTALAAGADTDVTVEVELLSTAGNVCQDAVITFDVVFDFEQNTVGGPADR